jgi:hypothetical protein
MLMTILVVLLVFALCSAGLGHARYGYSGWSPPLLIVAVLLVMWLTGNLHR